MKIINHSVFIVLSIGEVHSKKPSYLDELSMRYWKQHTSDKITNQQMS